GFNVDWGSSRCIAWGSRGQCLLWCLMTGQLLEKLVGHSQAISGMACSWEKERVLSYGAGPLCLWSLSSGPLCSHLLGHSDVVAGVEVSWEEDRAVSWADDSTLRLWDLKERVCLCEFRGHAGPVWSAQVDWDGGRMLSYSFAQRVLFLWDLKTGEPQKFPLGQKVIAWTGGAEVDWAMWLLLGASTTMRSLWPIFVPEPSASFVAPLQ
ncbi:unnamed protein product, partial [Symbiodinium pilosum]